MNDFPKDGRTHVTVIGAGAVGITAALELIRAGCAVRVIDKLPPGEGCSFGNAGVFAAASAQPLANARTMLKVPGWLIDPQGPLHIRIRYLPRLVPWLTRFGWHGLFGDKDAATEAMHMLVASSVDDYTRLASEAGVSDLIRRNGWIYAYNSLAEMRSNTPTVEADGERGFAFENLSAAELQARVPGISPHYIGGHHILGVGHTINPGRLVKALAALVERLGGEIVEAEVEAIERSDTGVSLLRTARGDFAVDKLVIAAGAYSARLSAMLGEPLPLETERGYHAMLPGRRLEAEIPVMDAGLKAVVTPMEDGVRAAGTVEFASLDAPENPQRVHNLLNMAKRMYPDLDTSGALTWMGRRPTLPDSLPVIDRSREAANVVYGFGHQHVGLTGAPATARLIRQLVLGEAPNIDMRPYAASRFS
ncbi:MAG: FAD-dependent oxidoreductase [Rhodospirillales bacterium]